LMRFTVFSCWGEWSWRHMPGRIAYNISDGNSALEINIFPGVTHAAKGLKPARVL
jgi:hypothetical protein